MRVADYIMAGILLIVSSIILSAFAEPETYKVTKVVDRETIHIKVDSKQYIKVRLHGIDTPEKGQPHSKAAAKALRKMVARE